MDVGGYTAAASVLLAMAHLAAEGFGLKAELTMDGRQPLVRTKETHEDGAEKTLRLKLSYDIGATQWANCLRQVLNMAGTDLTLPNNGPVTDATVSWHMSDAGNYGVDNFVRFDASGIPQTTDAVSSKTDGNGEAIMKLQGLRQRYVLPQDTKPFERYVTITAGISTKDSNLFNDLNDAVSAFESATGGPAAVIASIVPNLIDRSEALSVVQTFRVRDWPPDFKISGALEYTGGYSGAISGIKCDGVAGEWVIHGVGGTFTIDMNEDGLGSGPDGSTAVLLQGNPAKLMLKSKSGAAENAVVVTPGNFPECHRG